jgi:serine/threonine-protein kinase PknK
MLRPSAGPGRGVNGSLRRPKLQRAEVDSLAATTDGWAAPLRLASPSLRECDDPAALIDHMSVRSHGIGEFLAENVLGMLEPALRDFLLAASITERICGGLASALAGIPRGLLMLEEVGQRDLFLRREDDEGEWRGSTT